MNQDRDERLVVCFERIASAFEGIHDELKHAGTRYWPTAKPQREPVVSRIPNEEDKAKESLGIDGKPINEWLSDLDTEEDDGIIGERTAQWLKDHPQASNASAQVACGGKPGNTGSKTAKNKS